MPRPFPLARIGRNEKCWCGSGRKFKACHGHSAHPEFGLSSAVDLSRADVDQLWVLFGKEVQRILKIRRPDDWWQARNNFNASHVTEIYRAHSQIFPANINLMTRIRVDKNKLSALYAGEIGPTEIHHNIVRFSLYSEKIFAFDPFHPAHLMMPDGTSPRSQPDAFLLETLKSSYFVCRMLPWIKADIVSLVPNPANLDQKYRMQDFAQCHEIRSFIEGDDFEADVRRGALSKFVEIYHQFEGAQLRRLIEKQMPHADNDDIELIAKYVETEAASNPALLPPRSNQGPRTQFLMSRGGASVFTIFNLSSMLNAFPYSDSMAQTRLINQISQGSENVINLWTPLAQAFRSLDFEFLNRVDPEFALSLRADGRLHSLRGFLFRLWQHQRDPKQITETQIRLFAEELREEYAKSREEWAKIHESLAKFVVANVGAIISGTMVFGFPAVAAVLPSVYKVAESLLKLRRFKLSNPMSVFIDLAGK